MSTNIQSLPSAPNLANTMLGVVKLSPEQKKQIDTWVEFRAKRDFTKEQRDFSYQKWYKGGRGWNKICQGGVGQMLILCWYHHQFKPNSNEWRPSIMINCLLNKLSNGKI
ncbi:hypothetical protein [Arcicella aurantiaca]|nr:hypothetical protein [Arcicella aurantiaca]